MSNDKISGPVSREIVIESGSDAGKRFQINMMSAYTGDRWARKLAAACGRGAARLSDEVMKLGPAAFQGMTLAIFGQIEDDVREDLFDTLLKCVQIKRGVGQPATDVLEYDFTDPMTLARVREEAFILNINFIKAAVRQLSPLATAAEFMGDVLAPPGVEPQSPT